MREHITIQLPLLTESEKDVLDAARHGFFAGQVSDDKALAAMVEAGYVRRRYEGAAGFLGLAKLDLTYEGHTVLNAQP